METDVVLSKKKLKHRQRLAEAGDAMVIKQHHKIWNTGPTTSIESRGAVFFYFIGKGRSPSLLTLPLLFASTEACCRFAPLIKEYSQKGMKLWLKIQNPPQQRKRRNYMIPGLSMTTAESEQLPT